MSNIVRFPKKARRPFEQEKAGRNRGNSYRREPIFRKGRSLGIGRLAVPLIVIVGVAGAIYLHGGGTMDRLATFVVTQPSDTRSAAFSVCGEGPRITCVVDGDTFWLDHQKIRIADIDTPELSPPRCEAERLKGEAAKRRLRELLNAGPFSLVAGLRDEDQYGRKLRTVTRDGRSLGDILVAEGLARRWDGARHPWCD